MIYYFAPLEGITDAVYRQAHRRWYPGVTRYFTPFMSPTQDHHFTNRDRRELAPENNQGVPLVPQLLGKDAEDFLWAVNELADMGYEEVDLNLGCPSNTVTAKGKGSGALLFPDRLDAFLEAIYASSPIQISIKTRIGFKDPEEFGKIFDIYKKYPISELIIHPRTKTEMYQGKVHLDVFQAAWESAPFPVCYNGDLFTVEDIRAFTERFPQVGTIMMGRGLAADPALHLHDQGQAPDGKTLYGFHKELCDTYPVVFGGAGSALPRMKAIWGYMLDSFQGGEAYRKKIIKAKRWEDFLAITEEIFSRLDLKEA